MEPTSAEPTSAGVHETDRHGVADVSADFYEKLCPRPPEVKLPMQENAASDADDKPTSHKFQSVPPFSHDGLHQAVKQLKNGGCEDTAGLTAELLKVGGRTIE